MRAAAWLLPRGAPPRVSSSASVCSWSSSASASARASARSCSTRSSAARRASATRCSTRRSSSRSSSFIRARLLSATRLARSALSFDSSAASRASSSACCARSAAALARFIRVSTESPIGAASMTSALTLRALSRVPLAADPAASAGCNARDSSQAVFDGSSRMPVVVWSVSQCNGRGRDMRPPCALPRGALDVSPDRRRTSFDKRSLLRIPKSDNRQTHALP